MPVTSETTRPAGVVFESSVVAELLFLLKSIAGLSCVASDKPGDDPGELAAVPEELARRVVGFWGDDVLYWELFVVAEEAGALVGPIAAAEIAGHLGPACETMPLEPALRSESAADRAVVLDRLRRLREDAALRGEYLRLVADVWAEFEAEWVERHLPVISRAVESCRAKEHRGQPWQAVVKGAETASEVMEAGWARARDEGSAVVAICAYGGSLVLDLPELQFFAMTLKDRASVDRARASELSRRLRAVADPTRLALLQLVAERTRGIGDLAAELEVSQPTVSNHVKLLRDAGLVHSPQAPGDKRKLVVDQEALSELFREVAELVSSS